jgi:hypothetical protein
VNRRSRDFNRRSGDQEASISRNRRSGDQEASLSWNRRSGGQEAFSFLEQEIRRSGGLLFLGTGDQEVRRPSLSWNRRSGGGRSHPHGLLTS